MTAETPPRPGRWAGAGLLAGLLLGSALGAGYASALFFSPELREWEIRSALSRPHPDGPRFYARVHAVRYEDGEVTFVLSGTGGERPELRLGDPADVGLKLAVAALVLRSLTGEEQSDLAYLDVSLPDRPVAGSKSQVST